VNNLSFSLVYEMNINVGVRMFDNRKYT